MTMIDADERGDAEELVRLISTVKQELHREPVDLDLLAAAMHALLKNYQGSTKALCIAGIAAGVLEHWRAWDFVTKSLESIGDPALGYMAYVRLIQRRPDRDTEKARQLLLWASVEKGSIPARMLWVTKTRLRNPLLKIMAAPFVFVYFYSVTIKYWRHDRKDLRLPMSYRRHPTWED